MLNLEPAVLRSSRGELISLGLIAYQKPLYQLLSLEGGLQEHSAREESADELRPATAAEVRRGSLKAMVERLLEQQRSPRT